MRRFKAILLVHLSSFGVLVARPDPLIWQWRNPLPHGNDINAVTAGDGRIVGVGDCRSIAVSTNAGHWTRVRTYEQATALRCVAYGNGKYVAAGFGPTNNTILHSADGLNWSVASLPAVGFVYGLGFNSVVFANGEFLAPVAAFPGNPGALLASTDGATWTQVGTINGSRPMKFLNGKYLLFGDDSLAYSTDGRHWSFTPEDPPEGLRDIAYGNGVYVAVDEDYYNSQYYYRIFFSTDLSAWSLRFSSYVPNSISRMSAVAYGNGRFVAMGSVFSRETEAEHNLNFTSTNGLNGPNMRRWHRCRGRGS